MWQEKINHAINSEKGQNFLKGPVAKWALRGIIASSVLDGALLLDHYIDGENEQIPSRAFHLLTEAVPATTLFYLRREAQSRTEGVSESSTLGGITVNNLENQIVMDQSEPISLSSPNQ